MAGCGGNMPRYLLHKLECFTHLSDENKRALMRLAQNVQLVGSDWNLIHEGDNPGQVNPILDGWACRYKNLKGWAAADRFLLLARRLVRYARLRASRD